jgi:hypothetical protein
MIGKFFYEISLLRVKVTNKTYFLLKSINDSNLGRVIRAKNYLIGLRIYTIRFIN